MSSLHSPSSQDIEELANILGHPGELDWSGDGFCFLEYDHDQEAPSDDR